MTLRTASIIIRCKNEVKGIGPTLDAVFAQEHRPHEVIVIDSGSTDGTLDVLATHPVRVIHLAPEEWSYSGALNLGAGEATSEVLVCLSAHCVAVTSEWLASMVRHFDDPRVAAVWGPEVRPGRPLVAPGPPIVQEPGTYGFANRSWGLSNGNSAIRRSLWEEVPFDEALPATEDKAWARAAMDRGYTIVHEPRAAVWHESHELASAFRRNRLVQEGFALMFPGEVLPRTQALRMVPGLLARAVARNLASGDPRAFVRDVRRLPAVLAALIGGAIHSSARTGGGRRRLRANRLLPAPAPGLTPTSAGGRGGRPSIRGGTMGKDPTDRLVTSETREAEREEAVNGSDGGPEPTPEEEVAADAHGPVDEEIAANVQEQYETGAQVKGEGRTP